MDRKGSHTRKDQKEASIHTSPHTRAGVSDLLFFSAGFVSSFVFPWGGEGAWLEGGPREAREGGSGR
jgi:hypothetical protein